MHKNSFVPLVGRACTHIDKWGLLNPVYCAFVLYSVNPSVFCLILCLPHYKINMVLAANSLIIVSKYLYT